MSTAPDRFTYIKECARKESKSSRMFTYIYFVILSACLVLTLLTIWAIHTKEDTVAREKIVAACNRGNLIRETQENLVAIALSSKNPDAKVYITNLDALMLANPDIFNQIDCKKDA